MFGREARTLLAVLAAGGLVIGCGQTSASRNSPPDPLFLSKHPVAGKFDAKTPQQVVAEAPAPPGVPTTALAEGASKSTNGESKATVENGKSGEERVVPATPVSRPKQPDESKPTFEGPAQSSTTYGHAADYSWIRGVLDKHYHGYMNIRYCDRSAEDPHGGKFTLEDDHRLASYRDGDVVWIEGELVPLKEENDPSPWNPFRSYRIKTIQLEQRPQ
jgi:hypothetical protein